MAQREDIGPCYRGEDVLWIFTMTPVTDITGWAISARVKQTPSDPTPLLTINASLTSPAAGVFTVSLPAASTTSLSAGTYAYDVWRTDGGSAAALALGTLTVKGTVRLP
jgi:hypothetical protein